MSNKPRFLVCGDVDGKFKTLFSRVESINSKSGPFDFLLCAGNFFGETSDSFEPYRNSSLTVPISTYILGPTNLKQVSFYPDISGCELCPNVSYLGKRGQLNTSSGLKMAYVSGVNASEKVLQDHTFTESDVISVRDICNRGQNHFRGVDILVTSSWPKNITNNTTQFAPKEADGSWLLSWLAAQIKPRYHFCALKDMYYERAPYKNHSVTGDSVEHTTRFIAVANIGNSSKQKWLYALSLEPIDKIKLSELYQQTTDQTECPYTGKMLLHNPSKNQEEPTQFFYDLNTSREDHRKRSCKDNDGPNRKQRPTFSQETCWFCLSSPEVEKHLIISIGDEVYLALAKGGLVPDHVLILPVAHHQSLSDLPDSVIKEINKFKTALRNLFSSQEKVPVFFERNYKTSHLQIQVVPVSADAIEQLNNLFQECAEEQGLQLDELPTHMKLSEVAPSGTPYFYVELPTGERLFHRARKNFPLQFGREVLASDSMLNMMDRADWRDCKLSKEEEMTMTKQFRDSFKTFDFTL